MENHNDLLDEQLLNLLDGKLPPAEVQRVMASINTNHALKKKFAMLRVSHEAMQSMYSASPSKNFTDTVLTRLSDSPRSVRSILRHGLLMLTGVAVTIVALILSLKIFDTSQPIIVNGSKIRYYVPDKFPSFDIPGSAFIDALIIMAMVMGFVVLDRAVLRPYFKKRMPFRV